MLRQVTLEDIRSIGIGAGILGTGGGGNPYLGGLHLASVIRHHGPQPLIDPFQLADEALVCVAGNIGAPTVSIEKLPEGTEMLRALRLLEAHIGREFDAIAIAEIGGANSMQPLICGLLAGIPTVDSDSMGRAFPEIQMSSFLFDSAATAAPLAMVDAADNAAVLPAAISDRWAEKMARNIAVSMGARAGLVGTIMSGAQLKASGVHYTMSLAHQLGCRVIEAQAQKRDVPQVVADELDGQVLFRGKISDVHRRTTAGFARGSVRIDSFTPLAPPDKSGGSLHIEFQNELLIARVNGAVAVTTPDLICIVTAEEGEPVTTELLRYGTRVAVIAVPAPPQLKSENALRVVGPGAFGYDVAFRPLPGGVIGRRPKGS
ncbi:MAG: DUF917 domain-containing protein [Chloroflexi bacterium]|nr:DUF917 domain-containing protein [Chloroflexota bacterium]MCY3716499.1 DUF917 domain-containing protein [Chloroflexota bacterium]MDE2651593.1 DUF917 domain-containing protein [Chloroflexota bacterium]